MSAERFSGETRIANAIRTYLRANGYEIVQLVCPGGQATYSVSWLDADGTRKTCYPDLLCVRDELVVGEFKTRRSASDRRKLLNMRSSATARAAIAGLCSRAIGRDLRAIRFVFALIHGEPPTVPDPELDEFIVNAAGTVTRHRPR